MSGLKERLCCPSILLLHTAEMTYNNEGKSCVKVMLCHRYVSVTAVEGNTHFSSDTYQFFVKRKHLVFLCIFMSFTAEEIVHFVCNVSMLFFTRPCCLSLRIVKTFPKTVWHLCPKHRLQVRAKNHKQMYSK